MWGRPAENVFTASGRVRRRTPARAARNLTARVFRPSVSTERPRAPRAVPWTLPRFLRRCRTDARRIAFTGGSREFFELVRRGALLELITAGIYRFWLATDIRRAQWSGTSVDRDAPE